MANTKISAKTATTAILDADMFYIVKAADTTKGYKITGANLLTQIGARSGWIPANETWQYVSATRIAVGGGAAASKYAVGDPWRLVANSVSLQGYIKAIPDNNNIDVCGDALTNNAFSECYYSHGRPSFFDDWFSLTAPTWTTTGTAFTNQPTTNTAKFRINGHKLEVELKVTCHATSGGTGIFIATFAAGQLPTIVGPGNGSAWNFSGSFGGFAFMSTTAPTEIRCCKYDSTALATNSQVFSFWLTAEI